MVLGGHLRHDRAGADRPALGLSRRPGGERRQPVYFIARDRSLTSFPVQVREVWLAFMLIAMLPGMGWLYLLLFLGMILVVFFDRCGIARVLVLMPWNQGVSLK